MQIMNEVSYLGPHVDESVVLALDDPELFKYPVAYMTEAGFWETERHGGGRRSGRICRRAAS